MRNASMHHYIVNGLFAGLVTLSAAVYLLFGWSGSGWKVLAVPTGSMQPAIPIDSLVVVHRVAASQIHAGDVITYISPLDPSKTISHRVIRSYLIGTGIRAYQTKGDANPNPDMPITSGSIVGKVQWHIPHAGGWLIVAKRPWVILPIVYAAAIPILLEELLRLSAYYQQDQPYVLWGYRQRENARVALMPRLVIGVLAGLCIIFGSSAWVAPPAVAMLTSNPVSLKQTRLTIVKNGNKCNAKGQTNGNPSQGNKLCS